METIGQVFDDDILAVIDKLGYSKFFVVSEGALGARAALHLAVSRPQQVRPSLSLLSSLI